MRGPDVPTLLRLEKGEGEAQPLGSGLGVLYTMVQSALPLARGLARREAHETSYVAPVHVHVGRELELVVF